MHPVLHRAPSRFALLLALSSSFLAAQQTVSVPDDNPATGTCSIIPFGTDGTSFTDQRYQVVFRRSTLNGIPPGFLTGLEFAACASGDRLFTSIRVLAAVVPQGTELSPEFDANLGASPSLLLEATNFELDNGTADVWLDLGLDSAMAYDGVGDLVLDIFVTGAAQTSGSAIGFHRGSSIPRLVAPSDGVSLPTTATVMDNGGLKTRLTFTTTDVVLNTIEETACPGPSGRLPRMGFFFPNSGPVTGEPFAFEVSNATPNQAAILGVGVNRANLPLPLSNGCSFYHDFLLFELRTADNGGVATRVIPISMGSTMIGVELFSQWIVVDASMADGFGLAATERGVTVAF